MVNQLKYIKAMPTAEGNLTRAMEIAKILRGFDADTQKWLWDKAQQILYEEPQSSNSGGKC